LDVQAHARGNEVRLLGTPASVELAQNVLEQLYAVLQSGRGVHTRDVDAALAMVAEKPDDKKDGGGMPGGMGGMPPK
jgi:phosphate starvation-inducible protein PhoH